jgi:mannose-6-phosphate isomerase
LAVLDFNMVTPTTTQPRTLIKEDKLHVEQLAACQYFETERIHLPPDNAFFGLCDGATFELWGVLEGRATIEWAGQPVTLSGVSWALLPADLGEFQVIAEEPSTLLRVIVPEVDDE